MSRDAHDGVTRASNCKPSLEMIQDLETRSDGRADVLPEEFTKNSTKSKVRTSDAGHWSDIARI